MSNQGNVHSGKQKNVIQRQKTDMENRHTQQRTSCNLNHINKVIKAKELGSINTWDHGPDALGWKASSTFLETPAELFIKSQVRCRRKSKGKL